MVFQLILIMLREFQETIKTIEQLKKRKHSSSVFLIIFMFLIIRKGGTLTQKPFFQGKTQWNLYLWGVISGKLGGGSKLETINLLFCLIISIVSWDSRKIIKITNLKNNSVFLSFLFYLLLFCESFRKQLKLK